MNTNPDPNTLHRTAKYFMDTGRADSATSAMELLQGFGLTVRVGPEVACSLHHQIALLTLINVARRTFLGGVEVVGLDNAPSLSLLAPGADLRQAVLQLGGKLSVDGRVDWPSAIIGTVNPGVGAVPSWQLTWDRWRGGVMPVRGNRRLAEGGALPLAPALAAAACAAEVFAYHAGDDPMAGHRSSGLSLWRPGADWQTADSTEPTLRYLPSNLWLIGLGNLGQAFSWLLACLAYPEGSLPQLTLQDFDRITSSNESTSLLSWPCDINARKTRITAHWLEARGFITTIEERPFGPWTHRTEHEPGAAFCGVDNVMARAGLEAAGFGLIVEAGLGAGPQGFRNIFMHTFPASRAAADIWSDNTDPTADITHLPAYQSLRADGMDDCGVARLAARTVAVPFVSVTAAALSLSEFLRRLHGGPAVELASLSVAAMHDIETVKRPADVYAFGYLPAAA